MTGIFDLAAQLGQALKQDERLLRLNAAKDAYEKNTDLQSMMAEYAAQQAAIEQAVSGEEIDTHLIDVLQGRIDELYKQITENEIYVQFEKAQQEVNALMNAVNSTITYHITGEVPGNCTHDCSTCGGCH